MSSTALPPFSIAMPVLNEERYVALALNSLLGQTRDLDAQILVLDGGSQDATRDIVERIALIEPSVRWVENPGRTQSAGCNLAAELSDAHRRLMLRADAHAAYPDDFVRRAITACLHTGATSVVVPMRTVGLGGVQRAIAATQNSRLGNGGSAHRRRGASRYVEHGHHAVFDLAFFRSIGGYDPAFTHNEDAELDVRGLQAGGRIWLCAEAIMDYFPRDDLVALARQYVRHGRGRARTIRKHSIRPKLRQCLPLAILASAVLTPLATVSAWAALPFTTYALVCLLCGAIETARSRDPALLLMGPAAMVMHVSWAVGFLDGLFRQPTRIHPLQRSSRHHAGTIVASFAERDRGLDLTVLERHLSDPFDDSTMR